MSTTEGMKTYRHGKYDTNNGKDLHHITEHLLSFPEPLGPLTERATRAASVKASLTPRFRLAEHSVGTSLDVSMNVRRIDRTQIS